MNEVDEFKILLKSVLDRAKTHKGRVTMSQQEMGALEAICYMTEITFKSIKGDVKETPKEGDEPDAG